ncbi:uncharacterized protein LODBEIA_P10510 [Lodderomyces beijingensis]|uniref:BHLH domain-containing protein n=1 Tax=Lodderomyces beijingensis TaxID=1775926 RepID=A0ABP0ZKX6_9ASCO
MTMPDSPNNDGFDNLLDMIFSADMDFEQAFSMYNNLQEKNAIGSFEELGKVQLLNSQYTSNLPSSIDAGSHPQQDHHQKHQQQPASSRQYNPIHHDEFAHSRQQILNGGSIANQQQEQKVNFNLEQNQDVMDEDIDDYDQFFTHTESNAFERFLDNLANPNSSGDPLQFYNHQNSPSNPNNNNNNNNNNKKNSNISRELDLDFNFEMHTMKVPAHLRNKNSPNGGLLSPRHMLIQDHQQHPQFIEQQQQRERERELEREHQFRLPMSQLPMVPPPAQAIPPQNMIPRLESQYHPHQIPPQQQQQLATSINTQKLHPQSLPSPPTAGDYSHNHINVTLKRELTEAFAPSSSLDTKPIKTTNIKTTNAFKNSNIKSDTRATTSMTSANSAISSSSASTSASAGSKTLITPPTSGDESKKRQSDEEDEDEESDEENSTTLVKTESTCSNSSTSSTSSTLTPGADEPMKKRRRSSNKPLLSLEQKRLNHSFSEQKRRQLCKLAYQRCLEQIIDLEAFAKLPELNEAERKSKRARINKEGLPNLSKHGALMRISNEMELIIGLNNRLKNLLNL